MASNNKRETHEKRRRAQDRQRRQAAKEAERRERSARKKTEKPTDAEPPVFLSVSEMHKDLGLPVAPDGKPSP